MNNLNQNLYNSHYSHIYVEKDVCSYHNTRKILSHFTDSTIVEINHYKDVFCRSHQNYMLQKQAPSLILAKKQNNLLYEGAPVCQNFGNSHFYYTSLVMNCIYDCEYCYLQGMYPSANQVIFVNLEDIFHEVELLLKKHTVYLCVSYDTDLLAIESMLGYVKEWVDFASKHPDLTIEIRTKSANGIALNKLNPSANVIFAWTLSPQRITEHYEHNTPSFMQRLNCILKAVEKGFPVRLCFDPMIYIENWESLYGEMIDTTFSVIPKEKIKDVSIGVFRVSHDYMKQMRKQRPNSLIIQYPFENDNGVFHYSKDVTKEMISFAYNKISQILSTDRIFIWEEND